MKSVSPAKNRAIITVLGAVGVIPVIYPVLWVQGDRRGDAKIMSKQQKQKDFRNPKSKDAKSKESALPPNSHPSIAAPP